MTSLRLKLRGLTSKKVPALTLVLVAISGMVAGVLAATMVVTQYANTGVTGSYRDNTGTITITDKGLAVVANAVASNVSSTAVTWGATGTDKQVYNTLVAGNWMQYFEVTTTLANSSTHTITITIRSGTGGIGTTLLTVTTATWTAPAASSTAKITIYLDLATQSITAPMTVFATAT